MLTLDLYSTPACHLCELAKEILWPLLDEYDLALREIDIADSDELLEAYGVRIPVLKSVQLEDDLGWPFDKHQAREYLDRINKS